MRRTVFNGILVNCNTMTLNVRDIADASCNLYVCILKKLFSDLKTKLKKKIIESERIFLHIDDCSRAVIYGMWTLGVYTRVAPTAAVSEKGRKSRDGEGMQLAMAMHSSTRK